MRGGHGEEVEGGEEGVWMRVSHRSPRGPRCYAVITIRAGAKVRQIPGQVWKPHK